LKKYQKFFIYFESICFKNVLLAHFVPRLRGVDVLSPFHDLFLDAVFCHKFEKFFC
jgi:hypothetical protein